MEWSFASEAPSLILVIIIAKFYYDRRYTPTRNTRLFSASLWLASGSIILNALCVYTIVHYESVPYLVQMGLNALYYMMCVAVSLLLTGYLFNHMLKHVFNQSYGHRVRMLLWVMGIGFAILALTNLWSGALFYFDSAGRYHRGPLNVMGYLVACVEILIIYFCYRRNRDSMDDRVKTVVFTLMPVLLLLVVFQRLSPDVLLNGAMITLPLLVFFVNFQNAQAESDGLTGVGSRHGFIREIGVRNTTKGESQLVVVALKNFARINQRVGHRRGNELLFQMATWIDKCSGKGRAYRFGNVTFALVLPSANGREAMRVLEYIRQRFAATWEAGGMEVEVPACFVTMPCKIPGLDAAETVDLLSFMVEKAKDEDEVDLHYDDTILKLYKRRQAMERLLEESIRHERFEVWYQPIYDCRKKVLNSAEALVRLRDYDGRLINPGEFIPLAEKNGLIGDIDWIVWKQVCDFLAENPQLTMEVSVNMSAQQFMDPQQCARMYEYMQKRDIPVRRIKLEITERVILQDEKYMADMMHKIADQGFRFCVDDFGVGYSNLSGVMSLPFDYVKLDRSLIVMLPGDATNQMVVRLMTEMFHNMGLKIVAEGVETQEEQQLIQSLGADFIQGFYYARPMPAQDALAFLAAAQTEVR